MIYSEINKNQLNGIIAVYDLDIKFFPFENNTIQPERMPIKDNLKPLIKILNFDNTFKPYAFDNLIPNNVLNFKTDEPYIVWTSEKKKKKLLFSDGLPMQSAVYPIPKLLWKYNKGTLQVFALSDSQNIKETNPLYQAPFLNVSNQGDVCLGNIEINETTSLNKLIKHIEYAFFNSYFTHTNTDTLINGNITDMYINQRNQRTNAFDDKLLIKTNNKIKTIL